MTSQNKTNNEKEDAHLINKFINLKSIVALKKVFNNIQKRKTLEILRYNNYLLQKLNLNINDYKEYSELYSSIEIEIIPYINKEGIFINITKKEDEKYFHIYFNDNKEKEVKRTNISDEDNVSKINIIINYQINSFYGLFRDCKSIEFIYFKKFYRNNINNMNNMFSNCSLLGELNLTNFNTKNVTDMGAMFRNCSRLRELNLSNFNTDNVTNMSFMFEECGNLNKLDLSNFNTKNVTDMYEMFSGCTSLLELDLSNFNTENVTNMGCMFYRCFY